MSQEEIRKFSKVYEGFDRVRKKFGTLQGNFHERKVREMDNKENDEKYEG